MDGAENRWHGHGMVIRPADDEEALLPRSRSTGRSYLYVLPCYGEDLLKVGFSRDPISRFRSLHRQFYRYFDLDEAFLVETGSLGEARRLERIFIERWPDHRAPPPLAIAPAAGGHTEWFRGVAGSVQALAGRLAQRYGHAMHAPLRAWLKQQFEARSDVLYGWSMLVYEQLQASQPYGALDEDDRRYQHALAEAIEACAAAGADIPSIFPETVLRWYGMRQRFA